MTERTIIDPEREKQPYDKETSVLEKNGVHTSRDQSSVDQSIETDAQPGVQQIEAITISWTKNTLIFAFGMMWLIYFTEGVLNGITGALNPYVTSAFLLHSLTPTVSVISSVIGGVSNVTIAKILDVFGRPQGYICSLLIAVIGLIMMAACKTVEAYAAAQVFYTVGNSGLQYSLSVLIADTTSLKNRGLITAFLQSPNLITVWLAGPISNAFLAGPGWRWAFGSFSIIIPGVSLPMVVLFWLNYRKAQKLHVIPQDRSGDRSIVRSFLHKCNEFDAVGLLLISAGFAFFLLPFNLYTIQAKGWDSPLIICFLVFGIVLIIGFVIWETFFAPITMFPYRLLKDRTVLGACILAFAIFATYSCWTSFFSSFLQVVNGLSVQDATYVTQTQTVGSVITSVLGGYFIRRTGHFKIVSLCFGLPLAILGLGLLIHFRQPGHYIGYIVMCQIFIAFGSGVLIICDEIAILAAASHQYIAISIAVLGLFGNIGGALGLTLSAAIWTHVFPDKLNKYLPADALPNLTYIYGDLTTQLSYPIGSETRLAIQHAYGDTQSYLLITGTCLWVIGIVAVLLWRNIDVRAINQTKGQIF